MSESAQAPQPSGQTTSTVGSTAPAVRTTVATSRAPAAIGPYAQAVRAGGLVFLSGQIPLDPTSGTLVEGNVEVQARRVMDNLRAVLEAAGSGFDKVVRATIYLVDLGDFAKVNQIYAEYVTTADGVLPARSTVQVAALPRGALVEIDLIALA